MIRELLCRRSAPLWVFSTLLAASFVVGRHVAFSGVIDGRLDLNHMSSLSWSDLPLLLVTTLALTLFVWLLADSVDRLNRRAAGRDPGRVPPAHAILLWAALAALLLAAWAPYILTYAPGSVMSDSLYSIAGDRANHHPIVFTVIVNSFARLGTAAGDINRGIFSFTLLQSLTMALALSAGVVWALKKGAPRWWGAAAVAYFALVPVFPIYAINVQKDPLFSLFVAVMCVVLFEVAESDGAMLRTGRGIAAFLVASTLVMFFRNNGIVVVLGSAAAIALFHRRSHVKFYSSVVLLLVVTLLIQGPGYDALRIRRSPFVESIGIMLQQIGYVVASGGEVTPDQRQFLSGILPYEEWRQSYAPCLVDTLKWNPVFDGRYLNANLPEFLGTWVSLLQHNPGDYLKAHALDTLGFWKLDVTNGYGFADNQIVPNQLGITATDLFEELTGRSIKAHLDAMRGEGGTRSYIAPGALIWIALLSAALLLFRKRSRYVLALAPCVALWTSVMLTTPAAFSLRYIFAFALCMPGILLLPFVEPRLSGTDRQVPSLVMEGADRAPL